ncbi:MAG: hypothetical protein R3240_10270, partial [Gammaproteobacteria bacterium]|nr:hypothetical protein [Gammaproteobacteria bacterium]
KSLALRNVFGDHPLLFPNVFQFRWLTEGLATYIETSPQENSGRGQGSMFPMMMRAEVINGVKPLEKINLDLDSWPAGTTNYLYGYYFFEFVEKKYGKQSVQQLISAYSNNLIPFNLNEAFEASFHKQLPAMWPEFRAYLEEKFAPEIKTIRDQGIVQGEALTNSGYLKNFAEPINNEDVIIAEFDGTSSPAIYRMNLYDKQKKFVANYERDARFDYHPEQGLYKSQQEIFRNTNWFYDIYHYDPNNQQSHRVTRGQRFRHITISPDGSLIAAVYSKLGQHSLVLLDNDGAIKDIVWEGSNNVLLSDIDWSPDSKKILASIKQNNNSWNIAEFDIEHRKWNQLSDNEALELQAQYSKDGKYIYYSADYDNIFNIYRMNLASKKIEKLSNVLGGAFYPKTTASGKIVYLSYSAAGYDAYYLETPVPLAVVEQKKLNKAKSFEFEYANPDFSISDYDFAHQLAPTWWEPRLYFSNDSNRLGIYTSGSDALYRHAYDITADWDLDAQAASIEFNYAYDRWFPLLQTQVKSVERKTYVHDGILLEALVPFLSRVNRWYLSSSMTYEDDTSTLYDEQGKLVNVTSRNRLFGLGAIWDNRRKWPMTHSVSDGRLVNIVYETAAFTNSTYEGEMLITDWREYISLGNLQFLGIRLTHGLGINSPRPFQVGGNYSDASIFQSSFYSDVKYRTNFYNKRRFPLRGYSEQTRELQGRRMLMLNLEFRLPI